MLAEIITIGDEILIGQITDTNSQWIAKQLNDIGVSVYQVTSVQDDKDHIIKAIAEAEANADIIIITGGLGPTKDDITKHTLTGYFDDELVRNKEIEDHIKNLFGRINYKYTSLDLLQAMLPKKALILKNELGTASGMWFSKEGKVIISLPGVPNEMKGLLSGSVLPALIESFHLPFIVHRTIQTYGMGESRVAERLEAWENDLPDFIKLAYLPSYGKLRLRLSAKGSNKKLLEENLKKEIDELEILVADIIVGSLGDDTLEISLNKLLSSRNESISLAESCTGGDISRRITSVPGASQFLKGALVAYTEQVKTNVLQVSPVLIKKYSVVSAEVAAEMAIQCQKLFGTDYAIATTGNAGPTIDDTDESVGMVYIAIASPKGIYTKGYNFGKPREKVIERASVKAMELLRKEILKNSENSLPDK